MEGLKRSDWRMSELFCFILLGVPLSPSFPLTLKTPPCIRPPSEGLSPALWHSCQCSSFYLGRLMTFKPFLLNLPHSPAICSRRITQQLQLLRLQQAPHCSQRNKSSFFTRAWRDRTGEMASHCHRAGLEGTAGRNSSL